MSHLLEEIAGEQLFGSRLYDHRNPKSAARNAPPV